MVGGETLQCADHVMEPIVEISGNYWFSRIARHFVCKSSYISYFSRSTWCCSLHIPSLLLL